MSDLAGEDSDEGQIQTALLGCAPSHSGKQPPPALRALQPQQADAVRRIFVQLEVLQREQVSLAMPEIVIGP